MLINSVTDRSRRGQAAAETMMLAFMVMVIMVAMFYLFQVTWASQNAHIRAREALFHGHTYMSGDRASYSSPSNLFDGSNYKKAEYGETINFQGQAWDTIDSSTSIDVTATITE